MADVLLEKPEGFVLKIAPPCCLGDLAGSIAEVESGMKTLPLVQFIQDWNAFPQQRERMLEGGIPSWCPQDHAAAIAAVVHALCDRDGYSLPDSIAGVKASQDLTLSLRPINSRFRRKLMEKSPSSCLAHRVFFEPELLSK